MTCTQREVLRQLNAAVESRDAPDVESAVVAAFRAELTPDFVHALLALLLQRGHRSHEDIVLALQRLKDPRAVNALYEAAPVQHEYLGYDEFYGFARKCTWALADIGTPEARARLEMLATNGISEIASYAKERLEKWEDELHRKGAP